MNKNINIFSLSLILCFMPLISVAQNKPSNLQDLIDLALQNNGSIKLANSQIALQQNFRKTATDIGKTNINFQYGQYNSFVNDNNFTISQSLPFPTVLIRQNNLAKSQIKSAELQKNATQNELIRNIKANYYQFLFGYAKQKLWNYQDSIFSNFLHAAELRFKTGETNQLEQAVAQLQLSEIRNQKAQNQADIRITEMQLQTLLNTKEVLNITKTENLEKLQITALSQNTKPDSSVNSSLIAKNPFLVLLKQQIEVSEKTKLVEKAKLLPDINLGIFSQTLVGYQTSLDKKEVYYDLGSRFNGFTVGVSFPLWAKPQIARIKVAEIQQQMAQTNYDYASRNLEGQYATLIQEYLKFKTTLEYYENSALPTANLILTNAQKGFVNGEIGYVEYFQALKSGVAVKTAYLDALNQYNQAVVLVEFVLGNE
jgi:cobalt-zinc-cadmium resistance protein CzcA